MRRAECLSGPDRQHWSCRTILTGKTPAISADCFSPVAALLGLCHCRASLGSLGACTSLDSLPLTANEKRSTTHTSHYSHKPLLTQDSHSVENPTTAAATRTACPGWRLGVRSCCR